MRYFYHILLPIFASTFFVLFFNIPLAEAGVIVRPPNNLGLVGYWSLDEGRGTQASDLSGRGNDGVLINSPEWVSGRFGRALQLNGSTQRVEIPDSTDFDIGGPGFTYAAWIKPSSFLQTYNMFMGHYLPYFNVRSNRTLHLSMTAGGSQRSVYGATLLNADEWYHAVATYDADGYMRVFLNGSEDGIAGPFLPASDRVSNMYIGTWQVGGSYSFAGDVDEVRVYNRALSPSEVQTLYANTKSTIVGEASTNYYSDGLVAHYTLDGSTLSGTTVNDVVGTSDGTLTAGPVPTLGRIGQGMLFNGTTGGISLGTPSALQVTGDQTIAMWVYPTTFGARRNPFAKAYGGEGTITQETSGVLNYYYGTNGGNSSPYQGFGSGTPVTLNTWNHIAVVRDLSSNPMRLRWYINGVETNATNASYAAATAGTNPALIGQGYVSRYAGMIDDVRIYNRALSANEVRGLAGGGFGELNSSTDNLLRNGLIGLWTFDSISVSGNTVQDLSNNGNDATIVGNPASVTGKIGQAMLFDGVDDYLDLPNSLGYSTEFSAFAWFKAEATPLGGYHIIFGGQELEISVPHPGGQIRTGLYTNSRRVSNHGTGLLDGNWHHLGVIFDGSTKKSYINGVFVGEQTGITGTLVSSFANRKIGRYGSSTAYYLNGAIDDVRIYNRALTEAEITQLYSMGQ